MTRVLNDNVWVDGREYRKGSCPPPEVAGVIGDHAWEDIPGTGPEAPPEPVEVPVVEVEPEAVEAATDDAEAEAGDGAPETAEETPVEPPRAGPGSAKAAWVEYAEKVGVEVPQDATRDDIIAAVDAARN